MNYITESQRKSLVANVEDYLKIKGKIPMWRSFGQIDNNSLFVTCAELSEEKDNVISWCTIIAKFNISNRKAVDFIVDEDNSKYGFNDLESASNYGGTFIKKGDI